MIILFTDFGTTDPYIGQMKAVLTREAADEQVVDLFHHVPDFDIKAAAYLLPAYVDEFPQGAIFICVVDPGVGSSRNGCVLEIDGRWFVGPNNGLFDVLVHRSHKAKFWRILDGVFEKSTSFHGRDVFAPVAARLAHGDLSNLAKKDIKKSINQNIDSDLDRIIYIDHFGNLIVGYRFDYLPADCEIAVSGENVQPATTFSDVPEGQPFYYKNANGLLEIAVNQGSAQEYFKAEHGEVIDITSYA